MTDTIAELHALLAKATGGPWAVNPFNAQIDCAQPSDIGGLLPVCQMLWPTDERSEDETAANAKLIATMRNALPALLDRVEALEQRIAEYAASRTELEAAPTHNGPVFDAALQRYTIALSALQQKADTP